MSPSVSVLTATFNCATHLPRLIDSLRVQTDRSFDHVVVDGASTDGTRRVIEDCRDVITHSVSEPDFGVYDALNKGIRALRTEYYIVAGSDDVLHPEAIARYKAAAADARADIVIANVKAGGQLRRGFHPEKAWLGHHRMITSHSVGMLVRTRLHERFGLYSMRYALLADGYFIKRACTDPAVRTVGADFLAGEFGLAGLSNRGLLRTYCELWEIQVATGENSLVQLLLLQARILKRLPRILAP